MKTILIAENDYVSYLLLLNIIEFEFKHKDLDIIWAKNGQEAVNIALNNLIDLVLIDIVMPVINGYNAIQKIKQIKPDLTIIVQTSLVLTAEKNKAFKAGCSDYLTKPIIFEELIQKLKKYLV